LLRPLVAGRANGQADGDQGDHEDADYGHPERCSTGPRAHAAGRCCGGVCPIGLRRRVGEERLLVDELIELLGACPPQHGTAAASRIATINP
jgi:hypothetical protein